MLSLLKLLKDKGIRKVRITGGEPLARKNIMFFFRELSAIGFDEITLTTNGVLIYEYLDELKALGINRINLSLDTLSKEKFHKITFRDSFDDVMLAMDKMIAIGMQVRMNVVVMEGINDDELIDLASLSLKKNIGVRFIEEMPFDGSSNEKSKNFIDYKILLERLKDAFPNLAKIDDEPASTSLNYRVPGSPGSIGLIWLQMKKKSISSKRTPTEGP